MKGWIWNGTLSDCNPSESLLAMDLIPGHWPVSDTDRTCQLIPGESPPLCQHEAPRQPVSQSQWLRQKHQSSHQRILASHLTTHDVLITACRPGTTYCSSCYTAARTLCTKHSPANPLQYHRQTKVPVVKCGNHRFMDCCKHQLVFTWWPCTMLLCFSRLRVTVVTPGHSHVTLCSSLRCLPAVTDCTLRIVPASLLYTALYTLYTVLHICTHHGENTDLRCTGSRPKSWSSPIIIITIIIISAPTELRIPGPCHFVWTRAESRDPPHYYRLSLSWWLTTPSKDNTRRVHNSNRIIIWLLKSR